MDRGSADVSVSGVLREAHHLVFISKTASENLDMRVDELIKQKISVMLFEFKSLVSIPYVKHFEYCNFLDVIYAATF